MELRLCPAADANREVTQECLNRNVLYIDGVGSQYSVKTGMDMVLFRWVHISMFFEDLHKCSSFLVLDCQLVCHVHVVFYNGGTMPVIIGAEVLKHDKPVLAVIFKRNSTSKMPLSLSFFAFSRRPFSSCADISITAKPNTFLLPRPTASSMNNAIALTSPQHFNAQQSLDLSNQRQQIIRCYPTNEALKPLVGIEQWCFQLCATRCPPTLCACVYAWRTETCYSLITFPFHLDQWHLNASLFYFSDQKERWRM